MEEGWIGKARQNLNYVEIKIALFCVLSREVIMYLSYIAPIVRSGGKAAGPEKVGMFFLLLLRLQVQL